MVGDKVHKVNLKDIVLELDMSEKAKRWIKIEKIIFLIVGICITVFLCAFCLTCNDCNIIVTIHLSIISLSCYAHFGLPIDKLIKIEKIG